MPKRKVNDVVMVCKIINGQVKVSCRNFFQLLPSVTRGSRTKINFSAARSNLRHQFFVNRAGSAYKQLMKKGSLPISIKMLKSYLYKQYADDLKFYKVINSPQDAESLQSSISSLVQWSVDWQIPLSSSKTFHMHLGPPCPSTYFINGQQILTITVTIAKSVANKISAIKESTIHYLGSCLNNRYLKKLCVKKAAVSPNGQLSYTTTKIVDCGFHPQSLTGEASLYACAEYKTVRFYQVQHTHMRGAQKPKKCCERCAYFIVTPRALPAPKKMDDFDENNRNVTFASSSRGDKRQVLDQTEARDLALKKWDREEHMEQNFEVGEFEIDIKCDKKETVVEQ
ncbi:hypothetical protein OSTOST_06111 [Ostertagia ostertagi]